MGNLVLLAINLAILVAIPASLLGWAKLLSRRKLRPANPLPLIRAQPRPQPFWTPLVFLMMMGLGLVISPIANAVGIAAGWLPPVPIAPAAPVAKETIAAQPTTMTPATNAPPTTARLVFGSGVFLLVCLITIGFLKLSRPTQFEAIGLRPNWDDAKLGTVSALLVIPPLMVLMGVISWLQPYQHDVLDVMQAKPSIQRFAALFIVTVIVTPFVEEFAIRVVLQGSLQRLADMPETPQTPAVASQVDGPDLASGENLNPYRSPQEAMDTEQDRGQLAASGNRWVPRARWPIVVTSVVFAMLHFGQGLAPIPLFFFSLALGYLYRQTGRITAPMVLHMILNGITMTVTFITTIVSPPALG